MDGGLGYISLMLGAGGGKLSGLLKKKAEIDVVMRAALLQLASGNRNAARATAALLASDEVFFKSLARICQEHLGVKPQIIASLN
jgi:hypothetical protein